MLNANYISLFGMQRVDIMIRQKFLNDLRDLQEINDCFRHDSSKAQQISEANISSKRQIPKKEVLRLPKVKSNSKQLIDKHTESKHSSKKEDAKHSLEKKTNANVYFWYYKDEPKSKQKQYNFKLPTLPKENLKKRKNSITNTEATESMQSLKTYESIPVTNDNDEKLIEIEEIVTKKTEYRPPSVESIVSIDSNADFASFRNKRRVILKTAQLKQLNLSPKFMSDAKKMVFIPSCKSFHPIGVTKYISETIR